MSLLVYTAYSPRSEYIITTLLQAAGMAFNITHHQQDYIGYSGPKLNYSNTRLSLEEIHISPVSLLYENDIRLQQIAVVQGQDHPYFFSTHGDLPFDIFAASFYLLTRYEEYLHHEKDMYGRYAHTNSLAYRHKFLHKPLVNLWQQNFTNLLLQKFPSLVIQSRAFRYLPTYDIDIAWSYRHKGLWRNAGGMIKSLLKGKIAEIIERKFVLLGLKKDPFDNYAWLHQLHRQYQLSPLYFFLLAQKNKAYDKNILPSSKAYQKLIKHISDQYHTGIHPSWQSGDYSNLLQQEVDILSSITAKPITQSRQHYIRMQLPETYDQLLQAGITEDYSMGYGSINGFRASYCLPYSWFNLKKNEVTPLTVFPFCYMEANSLYEQHYNAVQALEELDNYYQVTRQVNGTLITIFHNHLITTQPAMLPWRNMYSTFLKKHFA